MDRGWQGEDVMPKFWLRMCLAVLSCSAVASAQKPLDVQPPSAEQPPAPSGPIRLEVVVTDKGGHPIPGLQQSDFSLFDNKQPVIIRSFAAHTIDAPGDDPEALILLIDNVNTNFNVVSTVRTQIENFLHSNGGRLPIPTAIFLLTDTGLSEVSPASTDGTAIASVLHEKEGELRSITRSTGFYGAQERTQLSLQCLERLTTYLNGATGRKLVVWIGPGWPIFDNPNVLISPQQQRNFFSAIVELNTMLRQADVTIDSLDPVGPADAASPHNFLWQSFTKPVTKPTKADPGDLALQVFALHSGGTARWGTNDLAGEMAGYVKDGSAWYTITFDPQRSDTPDAWHDVLVKLDKPDLRVRTSNGYYGQP
jgi:VWFA-related protein